MLIDIGANLTNKRFKNDLPETLERARENDVQHIILTGTNLQSSLDAFNLVNQYPTFLSSTAGVHPHDAKNWNDQVKGELVKLLQEEKVVAIGECGLDFNRNFSSPEKQEACFEAQIEMAVQSQKPMFLHERDAHQRFLEMLSAHRNELASLVVHCFTGNKSQLEAYLDLDCYIGITGWVCDERRGGSLREALPYIPRDRLLIETDAPYLLPRNLTQKPKKGRNEPSFLGHILKEIALIRDEKQDELGKKILENTRLFFGI